MKYVQHLPFRYVKAETARRGQKMIDQLGSGQPVTIDTIEHIASGRGKRIVIHHSRDRQIEFREGNFIQIVPEENATYL